MRAEGPECDDIDDTIADFFDDGEVIFRKHQDFEINGIQYNKLLVLQKKMREFTDNHSIYYSHKPTKELLKLPEWTEIQNLAREVLDSFHFHKQ